MSRFFFDFRQGVDLATDHEGIEFPGMEEAYLDAYEAALDMWSELLRQRRDPTLCYFEVRNEARELLFTLPFSEVMDACKDRKTTLAARVRVDAIATRQYAEYASVNLAKTIKVMRQTLRDSQALLDRKN